jgi:type IV pilus assembly protein PilM
MLFGIFSSFFKDRSGEALISVDIGSNYIKLMELELSSSGKPKLVSAGFAPTPAGAIQNNIIIRPDAVAETIRSIMEANDMSALAAVTAVPGPSVFTKKITIGQCPLKELDNNISFEAGNYIPHSIDAVHLDYQVLSTNGTSTMDVLLVAVKNEIIRSYIDTLEQAGLEPCIIDVDYFALENMFELCYPEEKEKVTALINVGARYSTVNIMQKGVSIFTGDVAVGGRLYTDALCETMNLGAADAERAKIGQMPEGIDVNVAEETIERVTEHIASELQRQIGFFWNATNIEIPIETIYLLGGGAQVKGLIEEISAKTGIMCQFVEPFRGIVPGGQFDDEYLKEIGPLMGVGVGLALRRMGDKVHVQ